MTWWALFGTAVAVGNCALTAYHWRIIRRGRRWLAEADRHHAEAERLLNAALEPWLAVAHNGHRPGLEHEAEP